MILQFLRYLLRWAPWLLAPTVFADGPSATAPSAPTNAPAGRPPRAVERLLEAIRQQRPDEYDRLLRLRRDNPARFQEELRRRFDESARRRGLATNAAPVAEPAPAVAGPAPTDVEERVAEIMREVIRLAEEYPRAPSSERNAQRERIRNLVAAAFDLREQDRVRRVQRLRQELDRLKEELDQRRRNRDAIVDRKVAEILGADPTSW